MKRKRMKKRSMPVFLLYPALALALLFAACPANALGSVPKGDAGRAGAAGGDAVPNTQLENAAAGSDYMQPFEYLFEDNEIEQKLEEIIKERDEAFLAELEEQALLAQIRIDNENALTSVSEDMKKFEQEEGEKLMEKEDEENGDIPAQTFRERMEAKRQEERSRKDREQVVSIQDVFASNTNKAVGDYEHTLVFKITAYCPCAQCNGPWSGGATATGVKATQGRTIAVDPRVIPYGSKVLIGGHEFVAEDCGGAVKGAHIDLYLNSHERTSSWGVRYLAVSWNGGSKKMIEALKRQGR